MSVSQSRLLELHARLKEVIGVDASSTMMDLLPPDDWNTVVRVHHLDAFREQFRAELQVAVAGLRTEFHAEINTLRAEFHTEINTLRTELFGEINTLRTELFGEINALRTESRGAIGELRADMHKLAAVQTRWMAGLLGSLVVAMIIALVR